MKIVVFRKLPVIAWLLFFANVTLSAQLCSGSLGDPVINISFGAGANPGPALKAATTNLQYVTDPCPVNGFYTVLHSGIQCNYGWHVLTSDHTGDPNGYFMLIDASFEPNDFYLDTVKGLCPNTTYEFAAWALNMKNIPNGIRPNINFNIETTSGVVLQTYNSGDVPPEQSPQWRQYGFFFKTPAGTSSIVLRMANKAPGGDGNDLALDDITFRPCGPLVSATIGSNAAISTTLCELNQVTLNFSAIISAGYAAPAFQWQASIDNGTSWNDIPGANSDTYQRLPSATGIYLYRLTVAETGNILSVNCRVASNPITVTINPSPAIAISNNGPVCAGSTTTLIVSGGQSFSWMGPNGFTASGANVILDANAATGKYYVTATTAGCLKTDSTIVKRKEKPVANFSGSKPFCTNTTIVFTNASLMSNGDTITKYEWDFGDGNSGTLKDVMHVYKTSNPYIVKLVVTSSNGCTDTTKQIINIHPLPIPAFGLPEVCLNDPFALFTDSSAIADNSQMNFLYSWIFGDANANAANPNTSGLKNPKHIYSATGIYQVQLMVTSQDGCAQTIIKPFTVNGAVPKADFSIDSGNGLCSNLPLKISNLSTVNFGGITKLEIYWDYAGNTVIKTLDDQPLPGKNYMHEYGAFGTPVIKDVQVKMVAYSGISCVSEITKKVSLQASPQVVLDAIKAVCQNVKPFAVTTGSNSNALTGVGIYTGDGINSNNFFDAQLVAPGKHLVQYTFLAANGCADSATQTIEVFQQPTVNAGPDRTVLEGGFITIQATATGANLSYLWTPNVAVENIYVLIPKVSPLSDQLYVLTVRSPEGCSNEDEVFVKVLKTPVIPTAFSPNGDGINDVWTIRYLDSYTGVDVTVFDRYGKNVYHDAGYNKHWDGTRNGKPIPIGTYYYIIDRKIAAPKLTGSVTIIR